MSTLAAQAREHQEMQEAHRRYGVHKLLTADAVAERLDVPKSTIYEAARQTRIGGIVRLGHIVRSEPSARECRQAKYDAVWPK